MRKLLFRDVVRLQRWKRIPVQTIALRAKVSRRSYYNWRDGVDTPRWYSLQRLITALQLTNEDLACSARKRSFLSVETLQLLEVFDRVSHVTVEELLSRVRRTGKKIVGLREARGLTQLELAQRTGLSKGLIWKMESGRQRGSFLKFADYLERIARVFDMTADDIF